MLTVYQYKETQLSIQKVLDNLLEIIKALKVFESRMKEDFFFGIFSPKPPIELYFFSSILQLSIESACLNYLRSSFSVDRNRLDSRTTYHWVLRKLAETLQDWN